jgi:Flp pilus assembly CpaF family ATPase
MTALRLYHAIPSGVGALEGVHDPEGVLRHWRSTVNGVQETLSEENERQWRETLQQVCQQVMDAAVCEAGTLTTQRTDDGLAEFMVNSVASLWREEVYVAKAMMESLRTGVAF